ncbi:MAG TPA: peptide deformylase [Sulfurimonas sp.]|nr:peptide deformylase [Sulfurimonas sp.]
MSNILSIAQLGASVIREKSQKVLQINSQKTQDFIDDLLLTCKEAKGMGIAAPQVSNSERIFIMSSEPNERYPYAPKMEPTTIINPEIISHSENMKKDWEGCLSLPGLRARVPRYHEVHVRYYDRDAKMVEQKFEGFLARIFQHEYDHLEGIVFIDRVESTKDIVMEKEFQRLISE